MKIVLLVSALLLALMVEVSLQKDPAKPTKQATAAATTTTGAAASGGAVGATAGTTQKPKPSATSKTPTQSILATTTSSLTSKKDATPTTTTTTTTKKPGKGVASSGTGDGASSGAGATTKNGSSMPGAVSATCKTHAASCLSGALAKYTDLKGEAFSKDDNGKNCALLKKAETCLKEDRNGNKCSDAEFSKATVATCFSPRTVASLLLIAACCIFSNMIGQQQH